jgi:hypothetical protein
MKAGIGGILCDFLLELEACGLEGPTRKIVLAR